MINSKLSRGVFALALLTVASGTPLLNVSIAHAQITSGDVVGTIKDASGAAVAGASVTISNEQTGVTSTLTSSSAGQYRFANLLPGRYDIKANASGFQQTTLKGIAVDLNKTATADVSLSVGSNSTVEVSANAGIVLDTTTQNLTQTFSNQTLSTLPNTSIGEGVLNASLLAPGVASTGGIGIGVGPSVGGNRPRNNNFTIEGIDNNDKAVTGPLVYVPNDAVGDFTLITNQFSPEFGHSSGGQFNTNIVSGTNKFHGKVYEYFQNKDLNAAQVSAGTKTPNERYDYNRYGGQLGGPIFRDKLFFFGSFERNTIGQSLSYNICSVTAAGFAALQANSAAFSQTNLQQFVKYAPVADATNSSACPSATTSITNAGGTVVTIPLGNFHVSAPNFSNFDALTTGADYTISSTDSLRVRYIYNTLGAQDTAANLPVFFVTNPNKYHLATISEYHNFTPNLTNEVRVGFNRHENTTVVPAIPFPTTDSFPNLTYDDLGQLNIGPDPNAPQFTIQNLYELTDNVSWVKGRHTIKIGFDGRKYISPQGFTQRARGDYEYGSIDVYLHDVTPDQFGERSSGSHTYYGDQTALYGYGNDTFRVSDKVTLNYGLRYEFTSVPFGERAQGLNAIASVPGLINFHSPQPSYTSFAPRVGVVFAPDEKTSIRAGFGIAYDVLFDNLGSLSFPPEYSVTQDIDTAGQPSQGQANFLKSGGLKPGGSGTVTYTTQKAAAAATSAYLPDQILPYSESYTLTIQRSLGRGLTAEVGYVGTRGIHLPTQIQYNVQARTNTTNNLPTYVNGVAIQAPGSSATTLAAIQARSNILPQFLANNFTTKITSYQPYSGSNYNGLVANLQGRMRNGLQMNMSYTWSKTMDNATAEVFATVLTPRRPQDSQNLNNDYSRSALDRTHRVTLEADYNFDPFKGGNFIKRSIIGNWVVSPIYTYESPEYATALSGVNSNLNGDSGSAIDRPLINPRGVKGTSSAVTPILAANGTDIIGYNAVNPNAYYVQAGLGTLPNASRNSLPIRPINNIDASVYKRFTAFDRYSLEVGAQAFNVLNHAQYIPGVINDVQAKSFTDNYNFQTVGTTTFNRPDLVFGNNPRSMQLSAKIIF